MSSSSRRGIVLVVCLGLIAPAVAPVHAAPTPADKEQAEDLFNAGMELREKGDLKGALAKLRAAHKLYATPITALELGRTLSMLGRLREAHEILKSVSAIPAKTTESSDTKAARSAAEKLAVEVLARTPAVIIRVEGAEQDQVTVTIDGAEQPTDTLGKRHLLNPGKYTIVAKAEGRPPQSTTVALKEGETRKVTLRFETAEAGDKPSSEPSASSSSGSSTWTWVGFGGAAVFGAVGAVSLWQREAKRDVCRSDATRTGREIECDGTGTLGTIAATSLVLAGVGLGIGVYGLASGTSSGAEKKSTSATSVFLSVGARSFAITAVF